MFRLQLPGSARMLRGFAIRLMVGCMLFAMFSSSLIGNVSADGGNVGPDGSPGWTYCADEGAACVFMGTKEVRYWGYDEDNQKTIGYRTSVASFSIDCSTPVFGGSDPAPGIVKRCYYRDVQLDSGGVTATVSGLYKIVTVTFGVYAREAGIVDLKSKIFVRRTGGDSFEPLGQADSVANTASTPMSSTLEIRFEQPLTGSENAIRIDSDAFGDNAGVLYAQPVEISPIRYTPPVLAADTTDNDTKHDIEVAFADDPDWRGAITAVWDGGTMLTKGTQYTVEAGIVKIKAGVLAKGSHSVRIEATGYLEASVTQAVIKIYASPKSGLGTEADPFLIATPEQLDGVRMNMNNGTYYRLDADIDLSEYPNWEPIGSYYTPFGGHMDGRGYAITGLKIQSGGKIGLFGAVVQGDLRNMRLIDVSIKGSDNVGGLAGESALANIENSSVTGTVSGTNNVGGMVGAVYGGTVRSVYSSADVSGLNYIGGVAGFSNGTLSYSYATGNVSGKDAGGLVGINSYGEIVHSFATGNVTGIDSSGIGGLVGLNRQGKIGYSYASGSTIGSGDVGGLVGHNDSGEIRDSYASSEASGYYSVGGLIGFNDNTLGGTVSNSYATGAVSGRDTYSWDLGGFIGLDSSGSVVNSFYDTVKSRQNVSAGGTGKETEAMKDRGTFEEDSANAWDFTSIWGIDASLNGGYPYLRDIQAFLVYDGNGNASGTVPAGGSFMPGTKIRIDAGTLDLRKKGSLFGGWNTRADGRGDGYMPGDNYTVSSNATLYAKWNPASETATLTSTIGTVSAGGTANETIKNVPHGTTLAAFEAAITPATGATFEVYDADGTTVATTLATGTKVIVTAQDQITTVTYTVTVSALSHAATLTSTIGTVSKGGTSNETITNVPHGTTLAAFKAAITPAAGATFEVYDADGTTVATTLATGKKVIVTAQDRVTKVTYTVTVNAAAPNGSGDGNGNGGGPVVGGGGGSGGTLPAADPIIRSSNGRLTLPAGRSGEVSLGDQSIVISIPAGATNQQLKISIDKVTDSQKLLANNDVLASAVYEVVKNFPEKFTHPVTITITFDSAKLKGNQTAAIFYYDEVKKSWVEVSGGKTDGNRITVSVDHFTKFAVLAVGESGDGSATGPKPAIGFSDIAGHWAEEAILQAASSGIVTGYPDGSFKPNHTVTRAEFAVMLVQTLKPQGTGAALAFADAAKIGAWAKNDVALAVKAGYLKGYADGMLRPDAAMTRAEMAMMVAGTAGLALEASTSTGFADDKDIPQWAKGAVAAAKQLGYMGGKGAGKFDPQAKTTRAEAVTVLLKLLAQKSK